MRIVCPGYRDPLDQLFRDESAAVAKRAKKGHKVLVVSARDVPSDPESLVSTMHRAEACGVPGLDFDMATTFSPPRPSLSQSINDVAMTHFMSSYVPGSHFEYLPGLYCASGEDSALPATVHAASLARLAWELGRPALMAQAKRSYSKALIKTNAALSNPAIATTDAVLVSVLLLSLYETIICADAETPENWIKHTRGALALIQLRGRQQLDTPVGRALFTQVANIICVDSLRSGMRLAPDLVELQKAALHYTEECPRFGMSSSTGELANLLADVKGGHLTPLGVVDATQRLEAKYIAFISELPASWHFEVEELDRPQADVYGTTIHHYSSNRVAQFWNSYRMTRIFLNGIMHGHARYLQPPNRTLLAQAERTAMEMATEICASVPQFTDPKHFSVASAATLLWPLSTVRSADLVGEELREYAEGRLRFLGRELRIPQAEKVASCREIDALKDGLHMFYLS
ncbi:hypothetical protein E8E12_001296 [Didymella heteroderae]|uniref:Sequence-specific DNA binding RNA polymerase II transcription factor n=1 Tax=Didymella heteroderae TaxID=1769908 RepID=A0A9P4WH18_9PLEO|nr:hypothetical protein E8E12_001296 [Didymella heteroderae]